MGNESLKNRNIILNTAKDTFKANKDAFIHEYMEALKIPSISLDSNYNAQSDRCAKFFNEWLLKIGLESKIIATNGNSIVYGKYKFSDDAPTVLIYGHYDVQPVIEKNWDTPPFTPTLKGERVYARGAHDDKGQICYVICAIKSLIESKNIGFNIKFVIDGEEECGSQNTTELLLSMEKELECDYLYVCDSESTSKDLATIILGLRGICAFEITLKGANTGVHSGTFGGMLSNPAVELCKLISSLYDKEGKVTVKGFYDNVKDLSEIPVNDIAPFDEDEIFKITGVKPTGGEQYIKNGNVRAGARPTIDVLYMTSGPKNEEDISNSIPPFAKARVSVRLVDKQDPEEIVNLIKAQLEREHKTGLKLEVKRVEDGAVALSIPRDGKAINRAKNVIKEIYSGNFNFSYEGGSIPIVSDLSKFSKHEPVLVGFGLKEDNIHADNESFSLTQFENGFYFAYLFLSKELAFNE